MERLTFEGNFCDIAQCRELPCPYNGLCSQKQVWERLKEYEDTERTPEDVAELVKDWSAQCTIIGECGGLDRLRELAEADKDGRVVVLPCKVGDTVWFNTYKDNGKTCIGIQPHKVTRVSTSIIVPGEIVDVGIPVDQFGKTIFLTKAEADKSDAKLLPGSPILDADKVMRNGN